MKYLILALLFFPITIYAQNGTQTGNQSQAMTDSVVITLGQTTRNELVEIMKKEEELRYEKARIVTFILEAQGVKYSRWYFKPGDAELKTIVVYGSRN